jgi:putative Holliday junction resolvase
MSSTTILALDVGDVRIGVARANTVARLAEPLATLQASEAVYNQIAELCEQHDVTKVVIGLPRDMQGQETSQTTKVRDFADKLQPSLKQPIVFQDESLTSVKAEESLDAQKKGYNKADVDAFAAAYILEDYLATSEGN